MNLNQRGQDRVVGKLRNKNAAASRRPQELVPHGPCYVHLATDSNVAADLYFVF